MIQITSTDLEANLGKYLALASIEDIVITENGANIAVLTAPMTKTSIVDELIGIIPNEGIDIKAFREERLKRYEGND